MLERMVLKAPQAHRDRPGRIQPYRDRKDLKALPGMPGHRALKGRKVPPAATLT